MRSRAKTVVLGLLFSALLFTGYVSVVHADDSASTHCCFLCPPNPPKDCDSALCNPEADCPSPKACCIVNIQY